MACPPQVRLPSSLTVSVIGVAKEILTVIIAVLFGDAFSGINALGLCLCILGNVAYFFKKTKERPAALCPAALPPLLLPPPRHRAVVWSSPTGAAREVLRARRVDWVEPLCATVRAAHSARLWPNAARPPVPLRSDA